MAYEAERQVSIARPPEQVFAFVADGLNGPSWRPGVLDAAHASGSGLGTVYRQGVRGPGGRRIAADYRITAWDPPRRLAFEAIAGPVRPTGEYRLEGEGQGTRLTFSLRADLGPIQRLLLGRSVQRTMEAEVAATKRLKQHLETGPA